MTLSVGRITPHRVDHPTLSESMFHVRPGSMRNREGTFQVHLVHLVPVVMRHLTKGSIAENACILDELSCPNKTEYDFDIIFFEVGVDGFPTIFSTRVFMVFMVFQPIRQCLPKPMFLFFFSPRPGHPWTPWAELHFRCSDRPQLPYINMTLSFLGLLKMPQTVPGHYLGL